MCIAILAPKEKELTKETLETCWENNPDGAGLMFAFNGKLYVHKEVVDFDSFYEYYKAMFDRFGADSPFAVHFRIRTHGNIDLLNCHPHLVNENLGFIHNGILSNVVVPKGSNISDTMVFNNTILKKLPPLALSSPGVIALLEKFCTSNKLVFLDAKGNSLIINKKLGQEDDGIWFSNTSYQPKIMYATGTYNSNYGGYGSHGYGSWGYDEDWHWKEPSKTKKKAPGKTADVIDINGHKEEDAIYCLLCSINPLHFPIEMAYGVCLECCETLNWIDSEDLAEEAITIEVEDDKGKTAPGADNKKSADKENSPEITVVSDGKGQPLALPAPQ